MIKIISVFETPPIPEIDPNPKLHVDLEVDGYPWVESGLLITWTKIQLDSYLQSKEADMLRQAQLKPPKGETYPKYRTDLGHPLPRSEHIGILTAVNTSLIKPATVTRKHMGVNYDVQCLVTESIKDMWVAGTLQIGDFVSISYIEEMPNETEKNVTIVTDKVYRSW